MSFGPAAGRASGDFPVIAAADPCPCGSRDRFDGCCGPLLDGGAAAPTAERLMRSRYTAFVVGDVRHLTETWHPRSRPDDLALDPGVRWVALEIVAVDAGGEGDADGTVEFRAHWRHDAARGVLHEVSRFVRRGGRWRYLDGAVHDA